MYVRRISCPRCARLDLGIGILALIINRLDACDGSLDVEADVAARPSRPVRYVSSRSEERGDLGGIENAVDVSNKAVFADLEDEDTVEGAVSECQHAGPSVDRL